MRIAFVVQRYGNEVNGGAEQHCRDIAERLAVMPDMERIKVFTTCARDHTTWSNHFPRGVTTEAGVEVERFPVVFPRIQPLQNVFGRLALHGPRLRTFEVPWVISQGPFAPELIQRLKHARRAFDVIVFFSYLYYPTIFGLPFVAERSLFVPTAHDEPALRMRRALRCFTMARAIAYNTEEEKALVDSRVRATARTAIVGCGVNLDPSTALPERRGRPYLLYLGRIETAKGVPELIRGFRAFRRQHANRSFATRWGHHTGKELELVLAGREGDMHPDRLDDIHWAGFVSDPRREALLRGCEAVVIPGKLDSLSLSLLEAWAMRTPTLSTSECPVKHGHVRRAGAGIEFGHGTSLEQALLALFADADRRSSAADRCERYVRSNYAWPEVLRRFVDLARVVADHPAAPCG